MEVGKEYVLTRKNSQETYHLKLVKKDKYTGTPLSPDYLFESVGDSVGPEYARVGESNMFCITASTIYNKFKVTKISKIPKITKV